MSWRSSKGTTVFVSDRRRESVDSMDSVNEFGKQPWSRADLFNVCEAWRNVSNDKPADWRNAWTSEVLHARARGTGNRNLSTNVPCRNLASPWMAIVHSKWHERTAAAWHTHGNFGERAVLPRPNYCEKLFRQEIRTRHPVEINCSERNEGRGRREGGIMNNFDWNS